MVCSDRSAAYWIEEMTLFESQEAKNLIVYGSSKQQKMTPSIFQPLYNGGLEMTKPSQGWSNVILPGKEKMKP